MLSGIIEQYGHATEVIVRSLYRELEQSDLLSGINLVR